MILYQPISNNHCASPWLQDPFDTVSTTATSINSVWDGMIAPDATVIEYLHQIREQLNHQAFMINEIYAKMSERKNEHS